MASRACSQFESGNLHSPGMTAAINAAIRYGKQGVVLNPRLIRVLHQTITGHDLGENSYRESQVTFGQYKDSEIVHFRHIPFELYQLCADVNALCAEGLNTDTLVVRFMMRFVRMQPFQDANKRTAFAVAAYLYARRDERYVLQPRHNDSTTFVDALYNNNEAVIAALICAWRVSV